MQAAAIEQVDDDEPEEQDSPEVIEGAEETGEEVSFEPNTRRQPLTYSLEGP
jgi:hypothetical protein